MVWLPYRASFSYNAHAKISQNAKRAQNFGVYVKRRRNDCEKIQLATLLRARALRLQQRLFNNRCCRDLSAVYDTHRCWSCHKRMELAIVVTVVCYKLYGYRFSFWTHFKIWLLLFAKINDHPGVSQNTHAKRAE